MVTLKNKAAVVTGSTSGIGLGIARSLARAGCDVTLNGLGDRESIDQECRAIADEFGVRTRVSTANIGSAEAVTGMVREAEEAFGRLDILVNNAGIQFVSPVEEFPPEKWEQIIAINLSAAFHATRAALPGMKQRKWGRIINTASAHALVASPYKSAYVAAKHGIAGFTKTVALEVATFGITANAICPGYVWTPMVEKQIPETMQARGLSRDQVINDVLLHAQPTKQFVTVEEVAAFAVFLCTDDARSITGTVLPIDGGWTAA